VTTFLQLRSLPPSLSLSLLSLPVFAYPYLPCIHHCF
jgi:hypothetical protein